MINFELYNLKFVTTTILVFEWSFAVFIEKLSNNQCLMAYAMQGAEGLSKQVSNNWSWVHYICNHLEPARQNEQKNRFLAELVLFHLLPQRENIH